MHISTTYIPTEADIAEGVLAFRRGLFRGLLGAGAVLSALGVVLVTRALLSGTTVLWPSAFVGFGVAMLALRFWAPIQAARQNKHMHGVPCEVTLTDEEFVTTLGGTRSETPWSTFRKIRRVDTQWIFEFGPTQAVTIPRRVFTDAENLELETFIHSRGRAAR
ncbi:YcxB family protein [Embleya sp. NPDC020630]|uniref:YcxB family protein n=1 Tax=unclassified Embleya TaxID=2699296 RepID=UPI0037992427